jgi:hypothetical protein
MDPEVTWDLEQRSLPSQGPTIKCTCALFTPERVEDDNLELINIMQIIGSCLKDVKNNNPKCTIKSLSQLVAVSEYVKLRAQYQKIKSCKWPCLSTSIAIAHWMGKGPYFACQI